MKNIQHIASATLVSLILLLIGCSKSDDQKEFENQAYSPPEGYTAMSANAQQQDQVDPDDWRISPDYQGLVEVATPAYPNPVFINSTFQITINIKYLVNLSRIEVVAFQYWEDRLNIATIRDSQISENSFPTVTISASSLPQNRTDNLYRILLFDQSGNVITYGDVKMEE